MGGGPTGSSSFSVAEWKLSLSLGGAGESSVVESYVKLNCPYNNYDTLILLRHQQHLAKVNSKSYQDLVW